MKRRSFHKQHGAVAIIAGIAIFALVGFAGLVADLGHLFIIKTELQNSMDACALAAAKELTGVDTNQLQRAENAGVSVGNINKVDYQGPNIALIPTDVTFSDSLDGNYQTRSAIEAGGAGAVTAITHVKCELPQNNISTYFIHVLGVGPTSSAARAKATLQPSQTNCAIPLGLCAPVPGTAPDYGFEVGRWYDGRFESGSGCTGSYNWIDFNPGAETPGCPGGGAAELACIIKKAGQCELPPAGTLVGQQGVAQSLANAFNTRFGIYRGSENATTAAPDFTGLAYTNSNAATGDLITQGANATTWASALGAPQNAFSGTPLGATPNYSTARVNRTPYQSSNPMQLTGVRYSTQADHTAYGADRRLTVAPIVNCNNWCPTPGQHIPIISYACVLLLNPIGGPDQVVMEYRGNASSPSNPCATGGIPAGGSATGPLVPTLVQ